jgi:hypothetical protein
VWYIVGVNARSGGECEWQILRREEAFNRFRRSSLRILVATTTPLSAQGIHAAMPALFRTFATFDNAVCSLFGLAVVKNCIVAFMHPMMSLISVASW